MTPTPHDRTAAAIVDRTMRAIHADPSGRSYVDDYAQLAVDLAGLDPHEHERVFHELADLARHHRDAGNDDLFRSLAELARIGLEPLARSERHVRRSSPGDPVPGDRQT